MLGNVLQVCVSGLQTKVLKVSPSSPEKQTRPPEEPTNQNAHCGKNVNGILYQAFKGKLKTEHCGVCGFFQNVKRQGP
jgi:hypothetical protein